MEKLSADNLVAFVADFNLIEIHSGVEASR